MAHPFDRSLEAFLRSRLAGPLPGKRAHRNYAHAQSYGRHFGPPRKSSRRAAVMILMRWDGQQWLMTLTKRPAGGVHSGQICFPGGGLEHGETVTDAAIRECEEETGWAPSPAEVLGQLSPIYVYGSDNYVSCLVAMTESQPTWAPDDREVAELLEAPLEHLCTDQRLHETIIDRRGMLTKAPCFRWQTYDIWGATSMMLSELKSIIVP